MTIAVMQRAEHREADAPSRAPGRISEKPAARPPSKRISASAMIADRARELVVGERDQPEPVGADEHADAEEQHEAGDPQAAGEQRRREAEREQQARDQDQASLVSHRGILLQPARAAKDAMQHDADRRPSRRAQAG